MSDRSPPQLECSPSHQIVLPCFLPLHGRVPEVKGKGGGGAAAAGHTSVQHSILHDLNLVITVHEMCIM